MTTGELLNLFMRRALVIIGYASVAVLALSVVWAVSREAVAQVFGLTPVGILCLLLLVVAVMLISERKSLVRIQILGRRHEIEVIEARLMEEKMRLDKLADELKKHHTQLVSTLDNVRFQVINASKEALTREQSASVLPYIAQSLTMLASTNHSLGRHQLEIEHAERALHIYEELARERK